MGVSRQLTPNIITMNEPVCAVSSVGMGVAIFSLILLGGL
jgi:hypothetical protein